MKRFLILVIIVLILIGNFSIALCECDCDYDCDVSIDSIIANTNDFMQIKIKIGDFEGIYKKNDGLDWVITEIPLICQDKNIAIYVENGAKDEIYNSNIDLLPGKNEIPINWVNDKDNKVDFTITINLKCPDTSTPIPSQSDSSTPVPSDTLTPTPTLTITSTPTQTIQVTVTPVTTSTSPGEELPQTGEATSIISLIVSLLFIIAGLILFLRHRHTQG